MTKYFCNHQSGMNVRALVALGTLINRDFPQRDVLFP
jgi:hypothetical protein